MDASIDGFQDPLLYDLAQAIRQRGWRAPVLFLLSVAAPLGFLGRQALLLTEPLYGRGHAQSYARALRQPAALNTLLALLSEEQMP